MVRTADYRSGTDSEHSPASIRGAVCYTLRGFDRQIDEQFFASIAAAASGGFLGLLFGIPRMLLGNAAENELDLKRGAVTEPGQTSRDIRSQYQPGANLGLAHKDFSWCGADAIGRTPLLMSFLSRSPRLGRKARA